MRLVLKPSVLSSLFRERIAFGDALGDFLQSQIGHGDSPRGTGCILRATYFYCNTVNLVGQYRVSEVPKLEDSKAGSPGAAIQYRLYCTIRLNR